MENTTPVTTAAAMPRRTWRSLLTGRWHASSWVAAVLLLLALAFCNVPGQVVTCIAHDGASPIHATYWQLSHGWPLTWLSRSIPYGELGLLTTPDCWTLSTDVLNLHWPALAGNFVIILLVSLIGGAAFELWRRARARVWQLHLREIFALLVLVSLAGAWYAAQQQRYAREQRILGVTHPLGLAEGMFDDPHMSSYSTTLGGTTWLRALFGDERFRRLDRVVGVEVAREGLSRAAQLPDVRVVKVIGEVETSDLAQLGKLPRLELLELWSMANSFPQERSKPAPRLTLPPLAHVRTLAVMNWNCDGLANLPLLENLEWSGAPVDEAALAKIAALPRLRRLRFEDCELPRDKLACLASLKTLVRLELRDDTIDDRHLEQLASLTQLRELELTICPLTGRGMEHLAALVDLESLSLSFTRVDDEGFKHLAALTKLHALNLIGTRVSPASIPHLARLKRLRTLTLSASGFSPQQRQQLIDALPDCRVTFEQ